MSKFRERVGGYRGRRTLTDFLKIIAVVLGILVLLVLIGFVFGQRFIVYSDDGLRLELPFMQQEEPDVPEIKPGSINMIERPGNSQSNSEENDPPEESASVLSAVMLDLTEIQNGTARETLDAVGANAVILEMKDTQGKLYWESQTKLAQETGVNGTPEMSGTLKQWLQEDVYTVAKVCCFRDNTIPYQRNNLALRATYGNWRDELGLRWMNPASTDTQAYLWELCRELAEMGFDEILLECYAFPEQGMQESITTQVPSGRTKTAVDFLTQARRVANENGAKLSVLVEPGVPGATETISGVTVDLLKELADNLWVGEEELSLTEPLFELNERQRLVCVRVETENDPAMPQAQLKK